MRSTRAKSQGCSLYALTSLPPQSPRESPNLPLRQSLSLSILRRRHAAMPPSTPLLYVEVHLDPHGRRDDSFDCVDECAVTIEPIMPTSTECRPLLSRQSFTLLPCCCADLPSPWWTCVESPPSYLKRKLSLPSTNSNHVFDVVKLFGAIMNVGPEAKSKELNVVVTSETFIRIMVHGDHIGGGIPPFLPDVPLWLDITPGNSSPSPASPWTWGGHSEDFLHSLALAPYPSELVAEVQLRLGKMLFRGDRRTGGGGVAVSTSERLSSVEVAVPRLLTSTTDDDEGGQAGPQTGDEEQRSPANLTNSLRSTDGGLLLYDSTSGSGKTVLAASAAALVSKETGASVYLVQCSKLISTSPFQAPQLLSTIIHFLTLQNAVRSKPAIIILDKVECIVPRRDLFPPNSDAFARSQKQDFGDPVISTLHTLSSFLRRLSSSSLTGSATGGGARSVPFPSGGAGGGGGDAHRHAYPSYPDADGATFECPGVALVGVATFPPEAFAERSKPAPNATGLLGKYKWARSILLLL